MNLEERYPDVRERIAEAAAHVRRRQEDVTIIAVTKTFPAELVRATYEFGIHEIGENKAQELIEKQSALAELPIRWHFIGHLQTNKVRKILPIANLIHSLDSVHLAKRIDEVASETDQRVELLIQVNTSGESTKYGIEPDEIEPFLEAIRGYSHLAIRGLMTLGPWTDDQEEIRRAFRLLRDLSDRLRRQIPEATFLSMGMSGDFEIAIEEGATHIRLGTVLFGPRG
jgi:pyridoxal phosphate enzyme (YggS family)